MADDEQATNGSDPAGADALPSRALPLPQHIAVVMDGNGRWARERNEPRLSGHRAGARSVRLMVEQCRRWGIRHLTLFSFSTENWNRSAEEVMGLMGLFKEHLGLTPGQWKESFHGRRAGAA